MGLVVHVAVGVVVITSDSSSHCTPQCEFELSAWEMLFMV